MAGDEDFCCALECAASASFAIKHFNLQPIIGCFGAKCGHFN